MSRARAPSPGNPLAEHSVKLRITRRECDRDLRGARRQQCLHRKPSHRCARASFPRDRELYCVGPKFHTEPRTVLQNATLLSTPSERTLLHVSAQLMPLAHSFATSYMSGQ